MQTVHLMLANYFIPHGHCYLWKPGLVGLHALSDALIAVAYFLIPLTLVYIVKKRQDVPFDWVFLLFGSFIICCGITHIMEIWTLWHSNYWLSGVLKAITAFISLCTAAVLIELIPKILAIPSPDQLATANLTLRCSETKLLEKTQQLEKTLQQLKSTQTQLVQTEKMSSLGQMVAGIAHEINNPVNFIYGNLTPAEEHIQYLLGLIQVYQVCYPHPAPEIQDRINTMDLDFILEDVQKVLASIKIGAQRIKEIVKSLRTFSRLDEAEMKEVNIHEGIDSTLMILQHRLKEQPKRPAIQVIKEYGNLPLVECYAGQLNQVFMNIISNAIDALEQMANEKLSVKTYGQNDSHNHLSTIVCPKLTIHIRTVIVNGKVRVSIADNGIGISQDAIHKLYDPFYTTKPIGYGTGLGLAISYQIIQSHEGNLQCVSEVGKGTEFIIEISLRSKFHQESKSSFEEVLIKT